MYLNTIYFGSGTYGIEKASEIYLGKNASDLSIAEAAMLAGMVQAPEIYSPFNDIESAKYRRDHVITQMYEQGFIDSGEYLGALAEQIEVNGSGNNIISERELVGAFTSGPIQGDIEREIRRLSFKIEPRSEVLNLKRSIV